MAQVYPTMHPLPFQHSSHFHDATRLPQLALQRERQHLPYMHPVNELMTDNLKISLPPISSLLGIPLSHRPG